MKKIILILCTFISLHAHGHPACLLEKLSRGQAGDFIVTAQEGNYSLLSIRSISESVLILEEISVPSKQIDLKTIAWKKWVADKAPGHTSWTLYEIDRATGGLIECFSYSKNGWLYLDKSEQFLMRFMALPLTTVPPLERKKIGPQPPQGETDQRRTWNPTVTLEGKKICPATFEVLKTQWPDDNSRLASSTIELYFSREFSDFPFPYWLELQSPHYRFKMRTIDSGHGLISFFQGGMPHRSPLILGNAQKGKDTWKLLIQTPSYFRKLRLFASDLTQKSNSAIPFSLKNGSKKEEIILEIST